MIKIIEKKKGISIVDIWYAEEKLNTKGIIRYKEAKKSITKEFKRIRTLLTDLSDDESKILEKFSKNCRYEIRRAQRENIAVNIKVGKSIEEKEIKKFLKFFQDFWESKEVYNLKYSKIENEIKRYAFQNSFAITYASVNGIPIVYHTYVVGNDAVRLYQSASHFRNEGKISQQLVGMANRFLHKEDMMYFKKQGVKIYDWGGAGEREEVASITKFKESFGGKEAFYYDGEIVNGIRAKLFKVAVKIIGSFSK